MTFVDELRGCEDVVLDTMLFIYLLEDHPEYGGICEQLFDAAAEGVFTGVVTPVTAAEVLVKPLQLGRQDIADTYRLTLRDLPNIRPVTMSCDTGFLAGALRAKHAVPLPDAIQAAFALSSPSRVLLTNDKQLRKIADLRVIVLSDLL